MEFHNGSGTVSNCLFRNCRCGLAYAGKGTINITDLFTRMDCPLLLMSYCVH